jgi:hypothetical protein
MEEVKDGDFFKWMAGFLFYFYDLKLEVVLLKAATER